mmetsp:Transcript_33180/g.24398  ORF Transcript_33180/g.24398 Transcript_33180/m.24398 type:complete len:125 (+) Transcript_33180:352-726(+)
MEYLIAKGCDVNVPSSLGRTALGKACWNGEVEVVRSLLKHPNIDIDYRDSNQRTALFNCVWGQYGGRLQQKSSYNPSDSPECAKLLLDKGANPNLQDIDLNSPLIIACGTGGARSIPLLVEYGA